MSNNIVSMGNIVIGKEQTMPYHNWHKMNDAEKLFHVKNEDLVHVDTENGGWYVVRVNLDFVRGFIRREDPEFYEKFRVLF